MNNDLISRQAAIDALWKALYEYEDEMKKQFQESDELDIGDWMLHRIFVQNMNDIDIQTILILPSAQSERKKGKWMRQQGDYDWADICSECGESYIGKNYSMSSKPPVNFCPNCGADMRGKE